MQILTLEQGTPEWHEARAGVCTASRFGDLMATIKSGEAASRRTYRAQLTVEQLTGKPVPSFTSAAMRQGTEREPFARMAYEAQTLAIVQEVGLCLHDTLKAGASPDGLIDDDGGLEIKCPELATHLEYLKLPAGKCPTEYQWQVQGAMWITGRAWWDFASYNPDFPAHLQITIRRVMRDQDAIDRLAVEVEKFMNEVAADVASFKQAA